MKSLRVINSAGSMQDHDVDEIPRIGELVRLEYGSGGDKAQPHYFRVKDVLYSLQGKPTQQVTILIDDETEFNWPE